MESTERNISGISYPCALVWHRPYSAFCCSSAKFLLMLPTPFTEAQIQNCLCCFQNEGVLWKSKQFLQKAVWKAVGHHKKKKRCWEQEEEKAGSRSVQTAEPWNVFAGCRGDAASDTLSRTTWKLLSHQSTGVQSTPHLTINIVINTASSSRVLILRVTGIFLAFWDSCLSDLTVHTLLINTVNPNSSSSPPEGLKSNFLLFCQNDWRNSSQKRSRGLSLRIAIYSV